MAAKNAFALLRLQDGEEPEKALENNVQQYKKDIETAKAKAKAPKYEKAAAPKQPAQQKQPRNDRPRKDGEQRERRAPRESNGERGDRRGPRRDGEPGPRRDGEPARRGDGAVHRERPEGKGNRAPRRENDRKSASVRGRQGEKTREESKLNLGKASEAEAEAAADADVEKTEDAAPAGEDAAEEPEEPKEVTLTLEEYKASLKGVKAVAKRKAGEGEDNSKFKASDVVVKADDMTIVDASTLSASAKSRRVQKKTKEQPKKVDLKLNFYQHDKGDERPQRREQRESRAPGSERGAPRERDDRRQSGPRQPRQQGSQRGASARTPDFNNAAAFPALG